MNATTIHSSEVVGQLVLIETDPIRQRVKHAIAGFLAGYSGTTLEAYRLDLRGWITWLDAAFLDPFAVERAHIELYARWCESEGKARSTIGRRLSTICGFYRYCSQERMIERDPSAHVRRPKQDYESSTLGLDRDELGAFLVQAGLCGGRDHALACLLALNGLRISEALGADIENLDVNRGHRTLFIHRKGNKTATIHRLDRHASARIVRRLTKAAGIDKRISPHSLRHSFITAALDAGVPLRDVQEAASHSDPRTTMRYDRGRGSLDRHATYIVSTFVAGASR
jgi:integrase/recombinase XerD